VRGREVENKRGKDANGREREREEWKETGREGGRERRARTCVRARQGEEKQ